MTLTIAIPSKGRLKADAEAVFARAGLAVLPPADERSYRTTVGGRDDLEVAYLSASEIARELALGTVHLGVTGEDLAREKVPAADTVLEFLLPLGFGHADVVVGVPEAWVDVETMDDLDEVAASFRALHGRRLRVATKYFQLTRDHFASHGVGVYRIVESLGATEGAPAAGQADVIVDITSTGTTLRANRLKMLDQPILRSQATLIASRNAAWTASDRDTRDEVVDRLAGTLR